MELYNKSAVLLDQWCVNHADHLEGQCIKLENAHADLKALIVKAAIQEFAKLKKQTVDEHTAAYRANVALERKQFSIADALEEVYVDYLSQ